MSAPSEWVAAIFAWGSGSSGQLGNGAEDDAASPTPVTLTALAWPCRLLAIACGGSHCILVTESAVLAQVLVFGDNEHGQLGMGAHRGHVLQPTPIQVEGASKIVTAGAGFDFSLFVDDRGGVFACGSNSHGQLGLGRRVDYAFTPTRIDGLPPIARVACGMRHSLCVSCNGEVFGFGEGKFGQLGLEIDGSSFLPVRLDWLTQCVIHAACGSRHSLCVDKDGSVTSFGSNRFGQRMTPPSKEAVPAGPLSLSGISCISTGWNHSEFLLATKVVGCGRNNYGQLGAGHSEHSHTPTVFQSPCKSRIIDVSCGSEHTLVLHEDGSVVASGWNEHGQLGLGHDKNMSTPQRLTFLSLAPSQRISRICAGDGFCIAVATERH